MKLQNLHTHTTFCDGKCTPEEMAAAAYEKGFETLGFSGHSYTDFELSWCMSVENTKAYETAVKKLKKQYEGKMEILLGLEKDSFSKVDTSDYDYVIGSVHYVRVEKTGDNHGFPEKDGFVYLPVDESAELLKKAIDNFFGGDPYTFIRAYYEEVATVVEKTGCSIIGHFDLVTKYQEVLPLFDEKDERYISAWKRAADALLKTGAAFEINTGAMARGYRSSPYPSEEIRRYLKANGAKLIVNSDAHAAENLAFGFEKAEEWLH